MTGQGTTEAAGPMPRVDTVLAKKIRAAALRTLRAAMHDNRSFTVGFDRETDFIQAVLAGKAPREISQALDMNYDELVSGCMRLICMINGALGNDAPRKVA